MFKETLRRGKAKESMTDEMRTGPKTRMQGVEVQRDQKQKAADVIYHITAVTKAERQM